MSGVETAMCSYNIWSDPPAQTGMMHTSPNPICTSQWAKCTTLPSHWCHKETENAILSGDETTRSPHTIWFFGNFIFFYQRKIVSTEMTSGKTLLIILLDRLMIYISLITFLTHATVCRMCSSMKQHDARQCMKHVHIHETTYTIVCKHRKHSEITGQRRWFGFASTPTGLQLWALRRTWRDCQYAKLPSLCVRLRLGVLWTP